MPRPLKLLAAAVALTAACAAQAVTAQAVTGQTPVAAQQAAGALSVKDLMAHVIDPAADGVWDRQGWELLPDGEHETFPSSDEGWREAREAATTVAKASDLLLTPERAALGPDWVKSAKALHQSALETLHAVDARDKQAFFDAGGRIYDACTACHERYIFAPAQ